MSDTFSDQLLTWFDQHGRHDLPWQHPRSPYRVWVSEIMLQQTQVATVIPYFERFMAHFPDLVTLAQAPQDEVLALWSGLGYYSRARNLHKAAIALHQQHDGQFPADIDDLVELPGIGRSTAAAILAQAFGLRHAILDGNVKRVLSRYHAVDGWPGKREVEQRLWQLAEHHTPDQRIADYTQAIMDLGATLCRRSQPRCDACPLNGGCQAFQTGRTAELPTRKPKAKIPQRHNRLLITTNKAGHVLLVKRPPSGIWGGLWSLPELTDDNTVPELGQVSAEAVTPVMDYDHTFSHFRLSMAVQCGRIKSKQIAESAETCWQDPQQLETIGLPAPIKKILQMWCAGSV